MPQNRHAQTDPAKSQVLAKALFNAGHDLGLSKKLLGEIVGRDRSSMERSGIDPTSKPGELALLLVRCYRSLYALTGGDVDVMRHWMHVENSDLLARPVDQLTSVVGLTRVVEYLDAMRGRA